MKGFLVVGVTDAGMVPMRVLHDGAEADDYAAGLTEDEIADMADGLNLPDPTEFYSRQVVAFVGGLPVEVVTTIAFDSPCLADDEEEDLDFDSELDEW